MTRLQIVQEEEFAFPSVTFPLCLFQLLRGSGSSLTPGLTEEPLPCNLRKSWSNELGWFMYCNPWVQR